MSGTAAVRRSLDIPSLDGLRALAVGIVFLAHAGVVLRLPKLGQVTLPGEFGVTVFFFLSGYLITTLLRLEHARSGSISLRDFYLRRVLRIFPPFYLVFFLATLLTAAGVLVGPTGPHLGATALASQALYLTNYDVIATNWWDGRAPGSWIYWSLAVEEHFYLFFPLLYLLLLRHLPARRRQLAVLLGICGLVLAWRCFLVYVGHVPKERTYIATDTRIDSILFGCALAVAGNPVIDRSRFSDGWWKRIWLPLGVVVVLASLAVSLKSESFKQSVSYSLEGVGLVPIFVCAMRYPRWFAFPVLNLRSVAFVGVVSYSLYLVHPTVLFGVSLYLNAPTAVRGVVGGLFSLGLALGIYVLVEKPAARLRRRLSHLPGRRPPEPAALPAGVGARAVRPTTDMKAPWVPGGAPRGRSPTRDGRPRVLMLVSDWADGELRAEVRRGQRPCPEYLVLEQDFGVELLDWSRLPGGARGRSALLSLRHVRAAVARLREFDVVFTDGEHLAIPLAMLMRATRTEARHLTIGHHLTTGAKRRLFRLLGGHRGIDRIVLHSTEQVRLVPVQLGVPGSKLALLPYAADAGFWSPQPVPEEPLVVTAGREHRDYATLAAACADRPFEVFVAAGSLHSPAATWTRPAGWPANFRIEFADRLRLRDLYARAAVVAVPLVPNDFQAGVTTIVEAMAMGKAVVVTATEGQRDVVTDGVTGVMVPPGDAATLRRAIQRLLDHEAERRWLGENARRVAERELDVRVYAGRLAAHARELAAH